MISLSLRRSKMTDLQALVARYVQAHDSHDCEALSQLCSRDCVLIGPVASIKGRTAIKAAFEDFLDAFGEDRFTVDRQLNVVSPIVLEWTYDAQHTGTYHAPTGDFAATHRPIRLHGVDVFDIEGDHIVRYRSYFDNLDLLIQIGAASIGS
jgi:uncharacterized protein (TIGR02246 family)